MTNLQIRPTCSEDHGAIERIYPAAFPDEDLLPLVRNLLAAGTDCLSLTALCDGLVAGHCVFTLCGMDRVERAVALLGPVCVAPENQRIGCGSALIKHGNMRLQKDGIGKVLVLGDPNYYGRFGFREEVGILTPHPIPDAWKSAWQSMDLTPAGQGLAGKLVVPGPWQDPALWA
ncbi:N-acetyltransferase [Roseibium denhamense]|uniref:Acetyltransferase n=1 Tax=Roseibium denhamense TaxID=76305 RepID=A0ABY1NW08_9HYPH|nr:N-acetyltransferase [Roseibium denhamense]MTI05479.1 N-acetyltransferase [Roseibium denhamense]SMP18364.1 putative acetyltransferase [Roseibium denhamense]